MVVEARIDDCPPQVQLVDDLGDQLADAIAALRLLGVHLAEQDVVLDGTRGVIGVAVKKLDGGLEVIGKSLREGAARLQKAPLHGIIDEIQVMPGNNQFER